MDETNIKAQEQTNPLGNELMVEVSIPNTIKISMVNCSELNDYKIWSGISAFLSNVVVGLFVAAITSDTSNSLLWINTSIFFVLLIVAIIMTMGKSKLMKNSQKIIKMKVVN